MLKIQGNTITVGHTLYDYYLKTTELSIIYITLAVDSEVFNNYMTQ